jgi:hypothetical protein
LTLPRERLRALVDGGEWADVGRESIARAEAHV